LILSEKLDIFLCASFVSMYKHPTFLCRWQHKSINFLCHVTL